jgi:hypothetical protein
MEKDRTLLITYKVVPIRTTTREGKLKQFRPLIRRGVMVKAGGGAMLRAAENLAHKIKTLLHAKSSR